MSLYEKLKEFSEKDRVSFHIPGHKGGVGLNPDWVQDAFSLDVTEFVETDDLQNPQGVLKEAEMRAAKAFGAERSFYLTGGTTLGLQTALLAGLRPGDKILLDRTCHRAVAAGLVLSGAIPVFLAPEFDESRGLYTGILADKIAEVLKREPEIVGMVLTSPTYYGICSDIRAIADVLHQRGKFLIVDEAHGTHFAFSEKLPETALSQGADVSAQSAHKTLPALGQSSLLHLGKESLISPAAAQSALRLLMTTSPSYLLMSAMDESISFMEEKGRRELEKRLAEIAKLKANLRRQGLFDFADQGVQDGARLVVDVRKTGFSGYQVAEQLKEKYGIYPEMADAYHLVLVVTVSNTQEDLEMLENALRSMVGSQGESTEKIVPLPMPEMVMTPREAFLTKRTTVDLASALGRIAADVVAVCPPGAAMLLPGQRIDQATIAYCEAAGITDDIAVVAED